MQERAILVAVKASANRSDSFDTSLKELESLAETAGALVAGTLIQARQRPSTATFLGKGKLEELKHLIDEKDADLVIFDQELTPVQLRNIENELDIKVIDRTMLILDIFAQRARSREGILQVELARLEYSLPRLTGQGKEMGRITGGIGTRGGAGEQKIELDRRRIRRRIRDLKEQMNDVKKNREMQRKQRNRSGIPVISLVGYTNAGKSSLFNALCQRVSRKGQAQVEADDRLFQTLDTTTRRIHLEGAGDALITDTVGFIRNLPHHLVQAFRSTLEEAVGADILLNVVDLSDPDYLEKLEVVEELLLDLGAERDRIITVFNKVDKCPGLQGIEGVYISARHGQGLPELLQLITDRLQ
ncbi:MAG: GTPase HflX [Deltaproteobacteria bacterium]